MSPCIIRYIIITNTNYYICVILYNAQTRLTAERSSTKLFIVCGISNTFACHIVQVSTTNMFHYIYGDYHSPPHRIRSRPLTHVVEWSVAGGRRCLESGGLPFIDVRLFTPTHMRGGGDKVFSVIREWGFFNIS
jgi:hypothetical protein